MVESLLGSTMSRAMSTLQNNQKNRIVDIGTKTAFVENVEGEGIGNTRAAALVDAAIDRANFQIKKEEVVRTGSSSSSPGCNTNISQDNVPPHEDKRTYLSNPAVTPTALAHSLWSQVVKPYQDTVIDATAGNGKDSLVLAKLLFPGSDECQQSAKKMNDLDSLKSSKLISIDIQKRACENTYQLLKENMGEEIMEKNCIQVLHTSHAPMPSLPTESVGLICYNLGYLPGTDDKEEFNTQMLTTIQSLADSALLIRPGGLLSVMSYPGNGWKEHCTVSYFMEGLAMFTTRDKKGGGWRGYLESIPSDRVLEQRHYDHYCTTTTTGDVECEVDESYGEEDNMTSSIRDAVKLALERVHSTGFQKQTWRVFEHKPLGRPLSPILFTGMRIK
jgi:Putative rRNA methylase.